MKRPYGPKLLKYGYPVIENWKVPPLQNLLQNKNRLPDYLILPLSWHIISTKEAKEFRRALLDDKGGYSKITQFGGGGFLNPRKNTLSVACWPLEPSLSISPTVLVMKKDDGQ